MKASWCMPNTCLVCATTGDCGRARRSAWLSRCPKKPSASGCSVRVQGFTNGLERESIDSLSRLDVCFVHCEIVRSQTFQNPPPRRVFHFRSPPTWCHSADDREGGHSSTERACAGHSNRYCRAFHSHFSRSNVPVLG